MLVPALSALLADAAWDTCGYLSPVANAKGTNLPDEKQVFMICPSSSVTAANVRQLQPPCVALDLGFADNLAHSVPRVVAKLFDQDQQLLVLCQGKLELIVL